MYCRLQSTVQLQHKEVFTSYVALASGSGERRFTFKGKRVDSWRSRIETTTLLSCSAPYSTSKLQPREYVNLPEAIGPQTSAFAFSPDV
jgi:hypothetical protein